MKAVIITRSLHNRPDADALRSIIDNSDILKIAVNDVGCKAHIRIFGDRQYWRKYLCYSEILYTRTGVEEIPSEYTSCFEYFIPTITPMSSSPYELLIVPSTLGAAIDLAYKVGVTDILLIADNVIKEDGKAFLKGFCNQAKQVADIYSTKINMFQFSDGNFNLPVLSFEDFLT